MQQETDRPQRMSVRSRCQFVPDFMIMGEAISPRIVPVRQFLPRLFPPDPVQIGRNWRYIYDKRFFRLRISYANHELRIPFTGEMNRVSFNLHNSLETDSTDETD